MVTTA